MTFPLSLDEKENRSQHFCALHNMDIGWSCHTELTSFGGALFSKGIGSLQSQPQILWERTGVVLKQGQPDWKKDLALLCQKNLNFHS